MMKYFSLLVLTCLMFLSQSCRLTRGVESRVTKPQIQLLQSQSYEVSESPYCERMLHKGKFATYRFESRLDSAFGGAHFSSLAIEARQASGRRRHVEVPSLVRALTYYSLEGAVFWIDDAYDCIILSNGESTSESGYADGVFVMSNEELLVAHTWSFYRGEIRIKDCRQKDRKRVMTAALSKLAEENDSWEW